jgi:hypothetical protein
MKRSGLILLALSLVVNCSLLIVDGMAQAPERFSYQGVARDAEGTPLVNEAIGLRLSLRSGSPTGTVVFQEIHVATTNDHGLFTVQIGGGTGGTGFSAINWGTASHFLQVELDPNGGTTYQNMGTTQLLSVPYALYAKNSGGNATTLDATYDGGAAGAGRIITADAGAVKVQGTDGLQITGTFGSGAAIDLTGAGTRMFFNPKKAALRAGRANGNEWNDANVGQHSVALGRGTTASGESSTALGDGSTATGEGTTALGLGSNASAEGASAMGYGATASGVGAVALGAENTASGLNATSIGFSTTASGDNATAIGMGSTASGAGSMAMGAFTEAPSFYETALGVLNSTYTPASAAAWSATDRLLVVGNGTTGTTRSNALTVLKNGNVAIGNVSPTSRLDVDGQLRLRGGAPGAGKVLTSDANGLATWQTPVGGAGGTLDAAYDLGGAGTGRTITADAGAVKVQGTDGIIVTGTYNSGANIEVSGAGARMFFNPRKSAFRAGRVINGDWDEANVGWGSVAFGANTLASGDHATAIGFGTTASGEYSTALGYNAIASGFDSRAMGRNSVASGDFSTAMGEYLIAPSRNEIVVGRYNTVYTPISSTTGNDADRLFVVGNGTGTSTRNDAFIILKSGEMKLGSRGTYLTNVQEGSVGTGSSSTVSKEVLIVFPTEFINSSNVRINVQAVNETPVADQYLVTVKQINTAGAMVIVRRMDGPTSWGQNLQLHWMAWE